MNMTNADSAASGLWPTFQSPNHLNVYDIRGASQDIQLAITTMTGIINRQQPQVYLLSSGDAAFWLQQAFAQIPHDVSPAAGNAALDAMLNKYVSSIQGLIIYDPDSSDSINIATMLAGQRNGIVVSPALASTLEGPPHKLPVIADLSIYKWKNRIQAYTWAERNLLKNSATNLIAGLDPKISGALRSFLVATRTFIYWLDAGNCIPDIFNGFVSECGLMQRIFNEFPTGPTHLGWFINEPQGVKFTSKAAMPVLASDFFENLEVWSSIQNVGTGLALSSAPTSTSSSSSTSVSSSTSGSLTSASAGPTPSTTEPDTSAASASSSASGSFSSAGAGPATSSSPQMEIVAASTPKAYVSFTISDGDNLQYNQHRMLALWKDPVRGTLPIGWTISPSLVQTAPSLATYYMGTMSPNDELIGGPSGIGYMYPSEWPQTQLPAFLKYTGESMQAMKLALIEVLDSGSSQAFVNPALQTTYVDVLSPFGVKGILSGSGQSKSTWKKVSGVPVLQNLGLGDSVSKTARLIKNASAQYINVYIMAWTMTPSNLQQVVQQLGNQYQIVKPSRLLEMLP
jgi:GxGYxYP putative glycoside hydrolase C-terminal domain/GxGYxYP third domain/GxGYxYP_N second domain/GxGYxYP_N 1st domain